jgi:arginyl-tRNA synthetase
MNIFEILKNELHLSVASLQQRGVILSGLDHRLITTQVPRVASQGDVATSSALALSKQALKTPMELASIIATNISNPYVRSVEVAAPGYVNFKLTTKFWVDLLKFYYTPLNSFLPQATSTQKILIEFVSANPTGPLHVGHTRGAVFGDVIANMYKAFGYNITREYYINDAGNQIETLKQSVEAAEQGHVIPDGCYSGSYISKLKGLRNPELEVLNWIKKDLEDLGVVFDNWVSELDLLVQSNNLVQALEILESKGLVYDDETTNAKLFRSKKFGDDKDRVIFKSSGDGTYFSGDIAYHLNKIHRQYTLLLSVLGADHAGYLKRIGGVINSLSNNQVAFKADLVQLVHLMRDGKPYKMSKRAGDYDTLRDVLDIIGKDAIRFLMLMQKQGTTLYFDLDKAAAKTMDNPLWYVQYAHARCCSVLKNATSPAVSVITGLIELYSYEFTKEELAILNKWAQWQMMMQASLDNHEPHRITNYLYELAATFHAWWAVGNKDATAQILTNDDVACAMRLYLTIATKNVLATGLNILGIQPLVSM